MSLRKKIVWTSFYLAALSLLTVFLASARLKSFAQSGQLSTVQSSAAGQVRKDRVEMVPITIRATGFEPYEIEHPSKPFLLAVDNQSGIDQLALELYQLDGAGHLRAKMKGLSMSLRSLSKREIIHLQAGQYVLREVNHPDWVCNVTITQ